MPSRDQRLVQRVAERLAAQSDRPLWGDLIDEEQRKYLNQAIGLLDLVDEAMPLRLVLCAHCPRLIPATTKWCLCDWPACSKCTRLRHKRPRR